MVFMARSLSISAAVMRVCRIRRSPDPTPAAYCGYVARRVSWYHLYRSAFVSCVTLAVARARCTRHIRDTNDTKRRQCDTPTIRGIPTMRDAGAVDVDFRQATFHSISGRYGRSGPGRRALRARYAIHQLRGV